MKQIIQKVIKYTNKKWLNFHQRMIIDFGNNHVSLLEYSLDEKNRQEVKEIVIDFKTFEKMYKDFKKAV